MASNEIELETKPTDGISRVQFSPVDPNALLVGSWDSSLRLYDVAANKQLAKFEHKAPVLGIAFKSDGSAVYSGGLDTWVRQWNPETEEFKVIGRHEKAVSNVLYSSETNQVLSGSWDQTIQFHDPRTATGTAATTITQPERVYHMDMVGFVLTVALAGRKINVFDVRNAKVLQERESMLRFQTRALASSPNGEGFSASSIEGRVSVEYFDAAVGQTKKYAFKCHRLTTDGVDHVWPVNSLAFHPTHHTLLTAGSDGFVSIWDHNAKKRLRQYPKYFNAVNDIGFNCDGKKLAVGVSYGWENGEAGSRLEENARVGIFVRDVADETKPKTSK